jgi:hypothetical protein
MSEPAHQIRRVLTSRQERKELLALACEVDRAAWRQACRRTRRPGVQLARDLLGGLETISAFLPGRLGRWLRGASFLTGLSRQFGWFRL